jgi:hypothetical protein
MKKHVLRTIIELLRILKHLDFWEDPRPPPQHLELVCEPYTDYVPWKDDVPEIEVG